MTARQPSILYAVVPSFYASVERAAQPSLRDAPLIVGGDPRKRGQVLSASPEALAAGVEPGTPVVEALQRCPQAVAIRTDMRRYREVAGLLRACLRAECDALEPAGLEGVYLDLSVAEPPVPDTSPGADPGEQHSDEEPGAAQALGERLVAAVRDRLGLELRVGIGRAKFLAKLAADEPGAPNVHEIRPAAEAAYLAELPVGRLPGVGPKTVTTLSGLGVETVGQLLSLDPARLEDELGNHGLRILELARGEDPTSIRAIRHPRTLSQEFTFSTGQTDMGALWERLSRLATGLESKLARQGLRARRVAVKVGYVDQDRTTRSRTLTEPVEASAEIYLAAVALLDRTHAGTRPVRLLGLSLSGLATSGASDPQLELFAPAR